MIYYINDMVDRTAQCQCQECKKDLMILSTPPAAVVRFIEDLDGNFICHECARSLTPYRTEYDAKIASVPLFGKDKYFWAKDRLVTI
jgi:hypothetical protein